MLVELTRIITKDGVPLDGAVADVKGRKRIGLLFVHGLTSSFPKSRPLWESLAHAGQRRGIGVAAFNNRGHDIMARYRKQVPRGRRSRSLLVGAGLEKFTESVADIRAGITFLKKRGYRRVVLVGHSTGAQKSAYYAATAHDRTLAGIILVAPISDVAIRKEELKNRFARNIEAARRFAQQHGPFALLPERITPGYWSAQRYLSLFKPNSAEDIFPYYNPKTVWKTFKKIRVPIYIVIGQRDEYLNRPVEDFVEVFRARANPRVHVSGSGIPRAYHSFRRYEDVVAKEVLRWIEKTI